MKKFLAIAVIAATLVACNDDAANTTSTDSTTTITTDSTTISTPVTTDTMNMNHGTDSTMDHSTMDSTTH